MLSLKEGSYLYHLNAEFDYAVIADQSVWFTRCSSCKLCTL